MSSTVSTNEREVVKAIREEAAALAEHMAAEDNTDMSLNRPSGGEQSKGEHTLMKLLSDAITGSTSTSSTEHEQLSLTPF